MAAETDTTALNMNIPQFGIFAQGTHAHHFLEFDLLPGATPEAAIASFRRLATPEVSAGGVNLVMAFGAGVWRAAMPSQAPASLSSFRGIRGTGGHGVPATQHDAWLWISGSAPDATWEHAMAAASAIGDVAILAAERAGFTYRDGRDVTGFIDGTANPSWRRAPAVALVPRGQPGTGGSFVLAMRWVHDLDAFSRLKVADQEEVFGRTKPDSVEIPDTIRARTAHISRVQMTIDGKELEIYRRSVPYGTVAEHGLYFVAFSSDPARYDHMLARMFGTSGDGLRDRLTEFSRAVSGAYYFAPSLQALNDLAGPDSN